MISLIAAVSSDGGLGKSDGSLLFHIKEDMNFFQNKTKGQICIYGRKTFDSIIEMNGKALPNRINVVLTRDAEYESLYGEVAYNSIDKILNHSRTLGDEDKKVMVCGGEEVYKLFLEFADEVLLTHVNKHVEEATSFFPVQMQDELGFIPVEESEEYYTEKYDAYYKFVRYTKPKESGVDDEGV